MSEELEIVADQSLAKATAKKDLFSSNADDFTVELGDASMNAISSHQAAMIIEELNNGVRMANARGYEVVCWRDEARRMSCYRFKKIIG